jgi:hypothetical protein
LRTFGPANPDEDVDLNDPEILLNPGISVRLFVKTDFGGYKKVTSIHWQECQTCGFFKLNDPTSVDKILSVVWNDKGETSHYDENATSKGYYHTTHVPKMSLLDICTVFNNRSEKKKTKFHDMAPIQTQVLEQVKKALMEAYPSLHPKFEHRAKKKDERAALSWGNYITVELSLENGKVFCSCPQNYRGVEVAIPEFADPNFNPNAIIQIAKEMQNKLSAIEEIRREIVDMILKLNPRQVPK